MPDRSSDSDLESDPTASPSTVYGPVWSWRQGWSLGVDLIQDISTCSFNCVYCQLGAIRRRTAKRQVFVPTERVLRDLEAVDWSKVDVVTISGCGEPALALNLGETLRAIRQRHAKPTQALTNAFHLRDPAVRADLCEADIVAVKLDAASDAMLARVNRPVEALTTRDLVESILLFKSEYKGRLCIQTMLMPMNRKEAEGIARLIREIQPAEAQLNTPRRFIPLVWRQENRGRHRSDEPDYPHRQPRTITLAEAREIEAMMRELTGVEVISVYRDSAAPSP